MTLEQQKQIEREFQDAKTPEEVTKAQTHAILALVDCQRKTGERGVRREARRRLTSNHQGDLSGVYRRHR